MMNVAASGHTLLAPLLGQHVERCSKLANDVARQIVWFDFQAPDAFGMFDGGLGHSSEILGGQAPSKQDRVLPVLGLRDRRDGYDNRWLRGLRYLRSCGRNYGVLHIPYGKRQYLPDREPTVGHHIFPSIYGLPDMSNDRGAHLFLPTGLKVDDLLELNVRFPTFDAIAALAVYEQDSEGVVRLAGEFARASFLQDLSLEDNVIDVTKCGEHGICIFVSGRDTWRLIEAEAKEALATQPLNTFVRVTVHNQAIRGNIQPPTALSPTH